MVKSSHPFEFLALFIETATLLFGIFFGRSLLEFKRSITKLAEDPRAVVWGVLYIELLLDQLRYSFGGPEISFPAMSLCSFFEQLDKLLSGLVIEL